MPKSGSHPQGSEGAFTFTIPRGQHKGRVECTLVTIAITEVRWTRRGLLSDADRLKGDLQRVTATDDFIFALGLVDQEETKTANETKTQQMRKFERLIKQKEQPKKWR